jgi:hypothetical protein
MSDPSILLVLMQRAQIYAETNQLRKGWLAIRKAVVAAREMRFADPNTVLRPSKSMLLNYKASLETVGREEDKDGEEWTLASSAEQLVARQRFIGHVLELDRMMSMVLGFPHARDDNFTDRLALAVLRGEKTCYGDEDSEPVTLDIKMRAMRRVNAIVAGRVNDRNASSATDLEELLAVTMEIQATLDEVAVAMPAGWWDVECHRQCAATNPFTTFESLTTQLWYWQVQAFLHLPFMLQPLPPSYPENDPYDQSRYLCLQGCRGMLRVFTALRMEPSVSVYICNCEDFQGVITASMLMVGLLIRRAFCPFLEDYHASAGLGSVADDLALLEVVKDTFRYRSHEQGGKISKQGLKVLEDLGSFLEDDYVGESVQKVVIMPYFGTIQLQFGPPVLNRALEGEGFMLPLTPPSSNDQLEDDSDQGHTKGTDIRSEVPVSESSQPSLSILDFELDNIDISWDQFLFGDELSQDWTVGYS